MAADDEQAGQVSLRILFWNNFLGAYPQVIASRDDAEATRLAGRVVERWLSSQPDGSDQRRFLERHPYPVETDTRLVEDWLYQTLADIDGPALIISNDQVAGDITPTLDRDLIVGVYSRPDDLANHTGAVIGFDQEDVEQRLVTKLQEHNTGLLPQVDLDDPDSVTNWLEAAHTTLPNVSFSVQQVPLAGQPTQTPLDDTPAVGAVTPTARQVWVGAVSWQGNDPEETPEFIADWTRDGLEHQLAVWIHQELWTSRRIDDRINTFLDNHTHPADWADATDVSNWLDNLYASSPGTAFAYAPVTVTPQPEGHTRLQLATLTRDNPFDAIILADTNLAGLNQQLAAQLVDQLDKQPASMRVDKFLAEWGLPGENPDQVQMWLDAYQRDHNHPAISIGSTILPPAPPTPPTPPPAPTVEAAGATAAPQPTVSASAPVSSTVRIGDLWAGVLSLDGDDLQVWVGADHDQVAQTMVRLLAEQINPARYSGHQADLRLSFLHDHPVNLGDPNSVEVWLDEFRTQFSDPAAYLTNIYDTANQQNLPPPPYGATPTKPKGLVDVRVTPPTTSQSASTVGLPTSGPSEVVVGVIRWDGDLNLEAVDTLTGDSPAQVRRQAAQQMWTEINSPTFDIEALADIGDPTGLDDQGIANWLDQISNVDGQPIFTLYENIPDHKLRQVTNLATTKAILDLVDPKPVPQTLGPNQVIIDTQRPNLWTTLSNGGIPDLLITNIDDEPNPNTCLEPDGSLGGPVWFQAQEDWMDNTMATAMNVAALPQLQARLEQLEYLRDRLARELTKPLPLEPDPANYQIPTSTNGGHDDMAYRWDHQMWAAAFKQQTLTLHDRLTKLVTTTQDNKPDHATSKTKPATPPPQPNIQATSGAHQVAPHPDVTVSIGFNITSGRQLPSGFPFTKSGSTPAPPGISW